MLRKATCCCEKSWVQVEGEPVINAICHCRNCKKRTGSAFGWSAYFSDTKVVQKVGELKVYVINGANPQQRWFCANCGSTIAWKVGFWPDYTGVAGGCFADNPLETPTVTVSNEGRCAWLRLPEDWRTSL